MHRFCFCVLAALVLATVGGAPAVAYPVSHVDDRCRDVAVSEPPTRIVSLLPFYVEILLDLTGVAPIVGIGDSPDNPAQVAGVASVGPAFSASREAIVALEPDLVLGASDFNGLRGSLEAAGVTVFTVGCFAGERDFGAIRGHADVMQAIRALAVLTTGDASTAAPLLDRIAARLAQIAVDVRGRTRPTVAVLYPDPSGVAPPSVAGLLTPEHAAIEAAGGRLAFDHQGYAPISTEQIVLIDPAFVIADPSRVADLLTESRFAGLQARRNDHVCGVAASRWTSSHIDETVLLLAALLHPRAVREAPSVAACRG
jgi:ABC-type Fe3+-hydroxamate transport system substrate-binding protein